MSRFATSTLALRRPSKGKVEDQDRVEEGRGKAKKGGKETYQSRRTIRHGARPLPTDQKLIHAARPPVRALAHLRDMLLGAHRHVAVAKHLILMMINNSTITPLARQEPIPRIRVREPVMKDYGCLPRLAHGAEAGLVVALGGGAATGQGGHERFVEELDADDDVGVRAAGVLLADLLDDADGERDGVLRRPLRGVGALAGVVEAVLA
jgi:hypothetical protein